MNRESGIFPAYLLSIKFDSLCGYKTHRDEECRKVMSGDEADSNSNLLMKKLRTKKKM